MIRRLLVALLLWAIPTSACAAITFPGTSGNNISSGTTSLSTTFTVTSGDLVVWSCAWSDAGLAITIAVSSSGVTTPTQIGSTTTALGFAYGIWWAISNGGSISVGCSDTDASPVTPDGGVMAADVAGQNATPIDVSTLTAWAASGTSVTTASRTPSQTGDGVLVFINRTATGGSTYSFSTSAGPSLTAAQFPAGAGSGTVGVGFGVDANTSATTGTATTTNACSAGSNCGVAMILVAPGATAAGTFPDLGQVVFRELVPA